MNSLNYPEWICHECGIKYCNYNIVGAKKYATYYLDKCQCCGKEDIPCTEPRDYGHFIEWPPIDLALLCKEEKSDPKTLEDLIDIVIESFDFHKVHRLMTLSKWSWWNGECSGGVPSIEQLRLVAIRHLKSVIKNKNDNCSVSSGGIMAEKIDSVGLSLKFIFAKSEHYLDEYLDE